MIPPGIFIPIETVKYIHPYSSNRLIAYQYGPIQLQNPSQGVLIKLWTLRVINRSFYVESATNLPVLVFIHSRDIAACSLAFDQNGNIVISYMDITGDSWLYWWDPTIPGYDNWQFFDMYTPVVTLDDGRKFNVSNSDIVLAYIKGGQVKYRLQRDRFADEYTPLLAGSEPIAGQSMLHISMAANCRLTFVLTTVTNDVNELPFQFTGPLIMRQEVIEEKAPVEILPITFQYGQTVTFPDIITSAASVITLESGTDHDTTGMLVGDPTFTDYTATQSVGGGLAGNVYRLAISVLTQDACVYVVEGLIAIKRSAAVIPEEAP